MTIEDKFAIREAEEHLRRLRSGELFTDLSFDFDGELDNAPDTTRAEDAIAHLIALARKAGAA